MSGKIEALLKEVGLELPAGAAPVANYVPFPRSGAAPCRPGPRSRSERGPRSPDAPMDKTGHTVTRTVHSSIAEIPAAEWDACAGDINPTLSYPFLQAMEESGSATGRSGWAPQHLSLADESGRVIGVVPLYLKSHSYGEYIFDYGWADAYERAGGRYFPKAPAPGPFTPGSGTRLPVAPHPPAHTQAAPIARANQVNPQHGN